MLYDRARLTRFAVRLHKVMFSNHQRSFLLLGQQRGGRVRIVAERRAEKKCVGSWECTLGSMICLVRLAVGAVIWRGN